MVDLVRRATDLAVLDDLLDHGVVTRPDVSRRTGISKPTVSQSMARLGLAGLVDEAGKTAGGRGRSGVRYRLADAAGVALALHAGPHEVIAQVVTAGGPADGAPLAEVSIPVGVTVGAAELRRAVRDVVRRGTAQAPGPVRAVTCSIADPVAADGRTVLLGGSPFVLEPVDRRAVLPAGAVIDNDVNWAALAEAAEAPETAATGATTATTATSGDAGGGPSFLYVYLGAGVGAAVVDDGRVRRGATGLAGELAYVATVGPDGRGMRLLDCLDDLGLTLPWSTVVDVPAARRLLAAGPGRADGEALVAALGGAIASAVALFGIRDVVVGGPWSDVPGLLPRLGEAAARLAPYAPVLRPARRREGAPLAGARLAALRALREALHAAIQ